MRSSLMLQPATALEIWMIFFEMLINISTILEKVESMEFFWMKQWLFITQEKIYSKINFGFNNFSLLKFF